MGRESSAIQQYCIVNSVIAAVLTGHPSGSSGFIDSMTSWRCQGWGLLSRFPPFRYFPKFSTSPKYILAIEHYIHIWQVLPQLSCSDTCQIWMRFKESNMYFCDIENFAYGEINERGFSNPHPSTAATPQTDIFVQYIPTNMHMVLLWFIISPW